MKLSDFEIYALANKEYNKMCERYGEDRILGTFVLGNANYGFADSADEIHLKTIYLPTFEELCYPRSIKRTEDICDIRNFYLIEMQSNYDFQALELLFSEYNVLNEKYSELFEEYFKNKREQIGRYNDKRRISQAQQRYQEAMNKGDYFEAARLWGGAVLYMNNAPLSECFHPTNPLTVGLLRALKDGSITDPSTLGVDFESYLAEASDETRYDAAAAIKEGVVKIMEYALEQNISIEAFVSSLTKTEKDAFEFIQTKIENGKTILSISKVVEESGISRPVFKNLLSKMHNEKIARVTNMGVKGTSIEML